MIDVDWLMLFGTFAIIAVGLTTTVGVASNPFWLFAGGALTMMFVDYWEHSRAGTTPPSPFGSHKDEEIDEWEAENL